MVRTFFMAGAAAAALLATSLGSQAVAAQPHDHPDATLTDIVRHPADLPAPLERRAPETVRVNLETVEVTGQLDDGTLYHYWTFNKKVPGPFIRVRVGDTVEVLLENADDSVMMHNIDLHAVTGLHGGGHATLAAPGESKGFSFKALHPGLYVYHCATPMVAQHIANGMYGMILVEPEVGLTPVDREFYVMQGEIYTEETFGTQGHLTESFDKLMAETPEFFVFNGAVNALTGDNALKAKVGETVRIFFGVGGPNKASSFHPIGEIFDRVYEQASLTNEPLRNIQTTLVPPGGATVVELELDVPGPIVLVDHALTRTERGLMGTLEVEGDDNPEIFMGSLPQHQTALGH